MSIYDEFRALAVQADERAQEYYRIAGWFPQKLMAVTEKYLGCSNADLELLSQDLSGHWQPWSGQPSSADVDEEGFFNVSVSIKLRLSALNWLTIYPIFAFRPTEEGVAAHLMRPTLNKGFERGLQILTTDDDASFSPLLDQCAGLVREMLGYNPFVSWPNRSRIGFDIRRSDHLAATNTNAGTQIGTSTTRDGTGSQRSPMAGKL